MNSEKRPPSGRPYVFKRELSFTVLCVCVCLPCVRVYECVLNAYIIYILCGVVFVVVICPYVAAAAAAANPPPRNLKQNVNLSYTNNIRNIIMCIKIYTL